MVGRGSFLSKIGVLTLNRIATMIMNFVAASHMAWALESANFGVLMFAISYIEYFTLVANLGFDSYLPRAVAAQPALRQRLVGAALLVRMFLALLLMPLVLLSLLLLQVSSDAKWVIVIVAASMFSSAIGVTSAYQGLQRMDIVAARGFAWSLLNMIGALLLVRERDDLVAAAAVTVASTTIANTLVFALYLREFSWPDLRVRRRRYYVAARRSSSFLLVLVLTSMMSSFKLIVLGITTTDVEVGLFAAALRLYQIATIPVNLLQTVFLPLIASDTTLKRHVGPSTMFYKLVVLTGLPIAGAGAVFTEQLVRLFFGPTFGVATGPTSLMMACSFIFALNTVQGTILVALGAQRIYVQSMLIGAGVSVLLDLLLIPHSGAIGAAVSTLAAQIAIALAYLLLSRPAIKLRSTIAFLAPCVLSVAGSIAAGYMLLDLAPNHLHAVLQLSIAGGTVAVVYPALLWITGLDPRSYVVEMRRMG